MKKKLLGLGIAALLVTSVLSVNSFNLKDIETFKMDHNLSTKHSQYKYIFAHAKFSGTYLDYNSIENAAKIIVIGTKENGKPVLVNDDSDTVSYFYTLSDFKVEKVIKNVTSNGIYKNESITIMENAAIDSISNQYFSIEGYQLMDNKKRYLLFLTPNRTEQGIYNMQGVIFGKYALEKNKTNRVKTFNQDIKYYEKRYSDINKKVYEKIIEKYNVDIEQ